MIDVMGKNMGKGRNSTGRFSRKKAQIGSTITWIGAFLIIFFILLLFLSASVVLSKTKKVLGANYKISAETIEQEPLMQSRMLISLLNSPITISYDNAEKEATIEKSLKVLSLRETGQESIKGQIENNLLELVKYSKPECYLFRISSNERSIIEFMDLFKAGGIRNSLAYQADVYSKAEKIYISNVKGAGQIEMGLYAGRC